MNLGLDPSDNGSGWHNQRAEAAEKRVAELEKAQMALAALASISGEPSK